MSISEGEATAEEDHWGFGIAVDVYAEAEMSSDSEEPSGLVHVVGLKSEADLFLGIEDRTYFISDLIKAQMCVFKPGLKQPYAPNQFVLFELLVGQIALSQQLVLRGQKENNDQEKTTHCLHYLGATKMCKMH